MYPSNRPAGRGPVHEMIELDPDLEEVFAALPAEPRRRLEGFNRLLESDAAARGYIARASARQSWQSHILDSLAAVPLLDAIFGEDAAPRIVDLGSGAGLPGIALAIARQRWRLTLLDERRGRAQLMDRFLDELQIENAQPRKGDAARESGRFDAAVARALAPPPRALSLCRRVLHDRGVAVLFLTCDQLARWPESGRPEPLGVVRYRLPGLRSGRIVAAFPADDQAAQLSLA